MPDARQPSRLERLFELGPAEANRLLPMEGLRGLAVILVFFVHYRSQLAAAMGVPIPAFGEALHVFGHAGVDLFFALSGYLIYGTLIRKPRPFIGFMARRVQRLYPVFVVVLALHLLVAVMSATGGGLPAAAWDRVVLIVANLLLLPGIFTIPPVVIVAWSLSYEMFFYLTVPLLIAGLGLRRWQVRWRVVAILAAVVVMQLLEWHHARMGMFACGMLLAEALPLLRRLRPRLRWLDVAALAAIPPAVAVVLATKADTLPPFVALFVACFLLCSTAFSGDGVVARMLMVRPLRWLGNMSYSYYLMHGFLLNLLFYALRGQMPAIQAMGEQAWWWLLVPAFAVTVLGSVPIFLGIERPFSILPAEALRRPALPPTGLAAAG